MNRPRQLLVLGSLFGTSLLAHPSKGGVLSVDISSAIAPASQTLREETENSTFESTISFDPGKSELLLEGALRTTRHVDPASVLTCRIADHDGTFPTPGERSANWVKTADGALEARFQWTIPLHWIEPGQQVLRLKLDAVPTGDTASRDTSSDSEFATLELQNIPPLATIKPVFSFVPHLLPAGSRCRLIAVWWDSSPKPDENPFVGSLDVFDPGNGERVEQRRILPGSKLVFRIGRLTVEVQVFDTTRGKFLVRPGLVSGEEHWYNAPDWFAPKSVRVVSPVPYVLFLMGLTLLLVAMWRWSGSWPNQATRRSVRGLLLIIWAWFGLWVVVSGYCMIGALVLMTGWSARHDWALPGGRNYAVAWLFTGFLEIYWGWLIKATPVQWSASLFSIAVWAVILLPLLFIKRRLLRHSLGFGVMIFWIVAVAGMTGYEAFFQDYPSVENLLNAGQLEDVGDSIATLLVADQWVPALVLAVIIGQFLLIERFEPRRRREKVDPES